MEALQNQYGNELEKKQEQLPLLLEIAEKFKKLLPKDLAGWRFNEIIANTFYYNDVPVIDWFKKKNNLNNIDDKLLEQGIRIAYLQTIGENISQNYYEFEFLSQDNFLKWIKHELASFTDRIELTEEEINMILTTASGLKEKIGKLQNETEEGVKKFIEGNEYDKL